MADPVTTFQTTQAALNHPEFLRVLHVGFNAAMGVLVVYPAGRFLWQMGQEENKNLGQRFRGANGELWGNNAIEGQALILGVMSLVVYYVQLWWGVPLFPEMGAILAIAGVLLTMAPPATEFDVDTETTAKWVLTFVGMFSFSSLLGTTMADMQICKVTDHECLGPGILWNLGSLVAIGVASLYCGMLSRRSRWNSFMAMNPPQSVVCVLQAVGPGLGKWVARDRFVKEFLRLQLDECVVLLQGFGEFLPDHRKGGVIEKATHSLVRYVDNFDSHSGGHHHAEDHEEGHAVHMV